MGANPGSIYALPMTWTCANPDWEGIWSWGVVRKWEQADWDEIIAPKLSEWSRLTWGEIDSLASGSGHRMHHNMPTEKICEEAQLRLMEIERYGDSIFRFRLGNMRRLWGTRCLATFEVVWYDPTHRIYPVDTD